MCSLNVCGFNSKLKYHVLQQYMQLFDFICLLETKCNSIDENELSDYKTFIMPRKSKTHKYGGIHGICILVKNAYASNCSVVTEFMSESVLWLHISKPVIGYEFLLGAVYLPHEASTYYSDDVFEYLSDDMTTIRAKYEVPTILMGDFNARTGTTSDFELICDHDELFIDNDPYIIYFEKEDIFHRKNKDKHMNRNGKKLIDFCKMSDMKILNGRIGKDKSLGNFTCYTTRGSSTIDYAIAINRIISKVL